MLADKDAWSFGRVMVFGAATYTVAALIIGDELLPGGKAFALLLIWLGAHVGAQLIRMLKMPPLVGMLMSGIFLINVLRTWTEPLPASWSSKLRAGALAVILMRSGLELDLNSIRRAGGAAMRLTLFPGMTEALVVGGFATLIFGMPIFLGLTLGFILAAVSPAVVVGGMFDLQKKGYGVKKGIPSIVVAASSLDDIVAITGYTLFIGLAVPTGQTIAWSIAHGPVTVFVGICAGGVAGIVLGSTILLRTELIRIVAALVLSQLLMAVAVIFHSTGAGAVAGLVMGIMASRLWARSDLPWWYGAAGSREIAHETERGVARFWQLVAQPILFGIIGTAVDFSALNPSSIPNGLLLIAIGVSVRLPTAAAVTFGAGLNLKERLFVAGAWLAKATVQGALASAPLDIIRDNKPGDDEWNDWGLDILTTAVFSIVITAPLGMLSISQLGPKWLQQDPVRFYVDPVIPPDSTARPKEVETGALRGRISAQHGEMPRRSLELPSLAHGNIHRGSSTAASAFQRAARASLGRVSAPATRRSTTPQAIMQIGHDSPDSSKLIAGIDSEPGAYLEASEGSETSVHSAPVPMITQVQAYMRDSGLTRERDDRLPNLGLTTVPEAVVHSLFKVISEHTSGICDADTTAQEKMERGAAIQDALEQFNLMVGSTKLERMAGIINEGDGIPGNFFRFARRTVVESEQQEAAMQSPAHYGRDLV